MDLTVIFVCSHQAKGELKTKGEGAKEVVQIDNKLEQAVVKALDKEGSKEAIKLAKRVDEDHKKASKLLCPPPSSPAPPCPAPVATSSGTLSVTDTPDKKTAVKNQDARWGVDWNSRDLPRQRKSLKANELNILMNRQPKQPTHCTYLMGDDLTPMNIY